MRSKYHRLILCAVTAAVGVCVCQWLRRQTDRATIQRLFWNPVYDRMAWLYDGVDWFTFNTTHRFRRRVWSHLPTPGGKVLEVGFGSGRLHLELARRYHVAGIDLARGMAALTRRRLDRHGLESDLRQGSVYHLPWSNNAFDAVVSTFAFSAFVDGEMAMDEMVRVVRPGGRIIIVDAGEARDGNRFAWMLARLWEWLGDTIRDEASLLTARGLQTQREEFGPGGCVHLVVGLKPNDSRLGRQSFP